MKNWLMMIKGKIPEGMNETQMDMFIKDHLFGKVIIDDFETRNLITSAGRRAVISALSNPQKNHNGSIVPRFKILKFGASTSTETPTQFDTSLGRTTSKRVIEQVDPVGDKLIITNFVGTPEMNFNWRKVGLFLSDGTLFSIAQCNEPKTNEVSKTVCWEIVWE